MAIINSFDNAAALQIEPVPKAARIVAYNKAGDEVNPKPDGRYNLRINLNPTALANGTMYFAMKNTGTKRVFVTRISMNLSFVGNAAASRSAFDIARWSNAEVSGGSSILPNKLDNASDAASVVTNAMGSDAGIAIAGATVENPFYVCSTPNQLAVSTPLELDLFRTPLVLNPGEGLVFRAASALVAGVCMYGAIFWEERA